MKPFYRLVASALFLVPGVVRGDIRSELPYHWLSIANHSGTFSTTTLQNCDLGKTQLLVNNKGSGVIKTDSPHGMALSTTGSGPYGDYRFDLPDGDWSMHFRARMANLDNGCVFSIGAGGSGTTVSLQLYTRTNAGLRLCQVSNKAVNHYVDINATGLCDALHDYTLVYDKAAAKVNLYIDGVQMGTLRDFTAKVGPEGYQWFAPYGGLSGTTFSNGVGIYLEEFRFYQRALAAEDIATLDNLLIYNAETSFAQAFTLAADEHIYLRTLGTTYAADAVVFTTGGITIEGEQDITQRVTIDGGTVKLSTDKTKLLFVPNADPYKAVWTGGGAAGDWRDPANWTCYTSDGTVISPSVIPTDKTTVVLTGSTSFTMPAGATPFWKATELQGTVTLTGDCRWDGAALYSSKATVACGGHKLTIANFTGIGSVTIQNGELSLETSAGTIGENNLVTTAATVSKLHKDGAGILVLRKTTGVKAFALDGGLLRLQGSIGIADGGTLTMAANTSFDTGGTIETKYGVFLNEGASLLNTGGATGSTKAQLTGGLTLAEGATVYIANQYEMSSTGAKYANYPIALNGGTIVKRGAGKWGVVNATISGAGTIRVEEGEFNIGNMNIAIAPDVVIKVVSGAGAYTWSQGDNLIVPTILGDGNVRGNSFYYTVTNRFSGLLTVEGKGTKFADGMTIDLTKNTSAYAWPSLVTLTGTSYTLDLSGRDLTPGEKVVAWSAKPANVAFRWDSETAKAGVEPLVDDTGIYYGTYIATAVWTGALGDGDASKPGNWECTDSTGKSVSAVPMNATKVTIEGENLNVQISNSARWDRLTVNATLGVDCDWRGLGATPLVTGSRIDLNGNALKSCGFAAQGAMMVTNSAAALSVMTFDIPAGTIHENSLVAIGGNLKFVKEGGGVFNGKRANQLYTGGTVVNAGAITSNETETKLHWGVRDSDVLVEKNGVLDIKNNLSWCYHHIILNGGEIVNTNGNNSATAQGLGDITLTADSTMRLKYHTVLSDNTGTAGVVDLGGYTLEFVHVTNPSDDKALVYFNNVVVSGGTLNFGRKTKFNPRKTACMGENVTLTLNGDAYLGQADVTVLNFLDGSRGDSQTIENDKRIFVTGRYTPKSEYLLNVTLKAGATLDLAGQEGVWTFVNELTPQTIVYEEGTITVDLAGRMLTEGEKIIAWEAKPTNVTFQWDSETAKAGVEPRLEADGLYYGIDGSDIDTARWTGNAGDYDATKPKNWQCTNFAGKIDPNAIPGDKSTLIVNVALTKDADWSVLGPVAFSADTRINLKGHGFTIGGLRAKEGVGAGAAVDNDATTTGDFVISVAEGKTTENTTVTIAGNTRLVKEGPGTFISRLKNQPYTGGTRIVNGLIKAIDYEKFYYLGAQGTDITIEPNGALDSNGWYDWVGHRIVLSGGILQNTGGHMTSTTWGGFGDMLLTADSKIKSKYHFLFNDNSVSRSVNMGGHTLTLEYINNPDDPKAKFYFNNNVAVSNGTLVAGSKILMHPMKTYSFGENLTWILNGDYQATAVDVSLLNFTDNAQGNISEYGKMTTVTGRYAPLSAYLHSVTLKDGSTLDLTGRTGAWEFTCKAGSNQSLTIDENAAIAVDLAGRKDLTPGLKVMAWTDTTKPAESVTFTPKGVFYNLVRKVDGLYLDRGVMTIFR